MIESETMETVAFGGLWVAVLAPVINGAAGGMAVDTVLVDTQFRVVHVSGHPDLRFNIILVF